ncbi:MAG: peptide chain release factor N(5)-glutamine methyltransferase [Blautia sp.]|nr:peptide chain release factor N(5)-glutamine methyltransferase [Blautia sp.]
MTLKELLKTGEKKLLQAGITEYDIDAWLLLSYVTGVSRAYYYAHQDKSVPENEVQEYIRASEIRAEHTPLQHITHQAFFMGYEFYVDENVLIPRQDTETLVSECLNVLEGTHAPEILDMCTGSGCILTSLLLLRPDASGTGADISKKALEVAEKNAVSLGSSERSRFVESDLFSASFFDKKSSHNMYKCDILVSNPPYIRTDVIESLAEEVKAHDPRAALDGGADGLVFYRRITEEAPDYLKAGGHLLFEIGFDQAEAAAALMEKAGFLDIRVIKDLSGNDRVVSGRMPLN